MPFVDISSRARLLLHSMAGAGADGYIEDCMLPSLSAELGICASDLTGLKSGLSDPFLCLKTIYGHYAFSRRGKDRLHLSRIAVQALEQTANPAKFAQFLAERDASRLWDVFSAICEQHSRKPLEQLNRGIISGLAELAQEIYRADGNGSIADWAVSGIATDQRLEPAFERIVDIRGVGPKITSLLLRDIVLIHGIEDRVSLRDRLYVQPIDKWIRLIAPYVIEEPGIGDAADWILAGKLAKYARHGNVSGIRFNIGVTAFGTREARHPMNFDAALENLLASL